MTWRNAAEIRPTKYICGFCGHGVASNLGFFSVSGNGSDQYQVYICPFCSRPTSWTEQGQIPGVSFGSSVSKIPANVNALYEEARRCCSVNAYTASVLLCRKLLMNIAVQEGANPNESFQYYVTFLSDNHFVPPKAKVWLDYIRTKGNEATHEIVPITKDEAQNLILFCEMLLKNIYEFPSRINPTK